MALPIAALEKELGVDFNAGDRPRFENRAALFDIFQAAAEAEDYAALAERMGAHGCTFENYRSHYEASQDPMLIDNNPLFGPSPANPSSFDYPAARSFTNIPEREVGDPAPAPFLGQHSEEVLAEKLGLSSGAIAKLLSLIHI